MANNNSCNNFAPAQFIVNPTAGSGTHTTIGAASTAASAGDTVVIMPATYTENVAMKTGVNYVGYTGDGIQGNVIVVGKWTYSSAGTVTVSNVQMKTNSDYFLAVSGSVASIVNLFNCDLQCSNNTGINFSSSSGSSQINAFYCTGNITTTGIALYTSSAGGYITLLWSRINNGGNSTTASSNSAGGISIRWCDLYSPFSVSSSASISIEHTEINAQSNATCVTTSGTSTAYLYYCDLNSGTASCISVGSGSSAIVVNNQIVSSNTNAVTGAGTIYINGIQYQGSSSTNNVTTQIYKPTQGYSNLQLISSQTASSSASITFTSGISSLYNNYVVIYSAVTAGTGSTNLLFQISTNGGVSYLSSNYKSGTLSAEYNTTTLNNQNSTSAFMSSGQYTTTAGDSGSGMTYFFDFSSGKETKSYSTASIIFSGNSYNQSATGVNTNTSQVNAISVALSSGNIATGTFTLFGVVE